MAIRGKRWGLGTVSGMLGLTLAMAAWADDAPGALRDRMQVIYDPLTREVTRQVVKVYDPHPEMGLEFTWEPAAGNAPGITPEGYAHGAGRLSWRVPGAASYDPRAVHHTYEGTLKNGRFDGAGRLSYRDGSFYRGTWVAGRLHGPGEHLDAAGNRYEGPYVQGRAQGQGTYRAAAGWVYTGGFRDGLRDGTGTMTEPGGLTYAVQMAQGAVVSSDRPVVFADTRLGGLLPAQSGGEAGDAAKADFSVLVDPRLGAGQEVGYTHYVQNGEVLILPENEHWRQAWNGAPMIQSFYMYAQMGDAEWQMNRAHTQFRLATGDGSRVKLKSLDLAVEYSLPHLRPVLATQEHLGCVGFRPSFNFVNYGWGAVQNATARVGFRNPDLVDWDQRASVPPATPWFEVPIGGFDTGVDVYVRNALIEAGVDVTSLESRRLTCPSANLLDSCRKSYVQDLNLGQIVGQESGYSTLVTDMLGEMSYDWTDALGQVHHETQKFAVSVTLGVIEVPGGLAECGDGGAFATQAPQYIDVDLPSDGRDYRINIPVRGNPNLSALLSGLKFYSDRSSMHLMQMEATFADGSVRKSAPVRLFYMHTRQPGFQSTAKPAICTLSSDMESSC